MPKLRVHNLAMSTDGYVAGRHQSRDTPLGVGGEALHTWMFEDDIDPIDADFRERGVQNIGATIMGRNMFGPIRGEWPDDAWRGWWGDDPPFHHPVFVLTHYAHQPIAMNGGTTFHFTADPIDVVLQRAFDAANGADVRLGGGAATVQEFLRAGLVDDLHVPIVPLLLRDGERLFDHLGGGPDGLTCVEFVSSPRIAHVRFVRP
jgi:dihydrofolate reductase